MNLVYCACVFSVVFCVKFVYSSDLTQMEALYSNLFSLYNRKLFPLFNHNNTVKISVDAGLVNINNFDELSGEMHLALIFDIRWLDERLKWVPSHYGGKSTLLVPPGDIWFPQLYVIESFDVIQEISNTSVMIRLYSSGEIVWKFGKVVKLVCSVDVTYFPFDTQTCSIKISGWAYIVSEVMLYTNTSVVHTDYYSPNSQWDLQSSIMRNLSSTTNDLPPLVDILLTLKRRNEFHVVYIITSLVSLGTLGNFVFIMPASSGERTSVAITTFLSFIVFMEMVNSNVPESSSPMAYIYYYLLFLLIYSSAILFLCIVSLRIYSKQADIPEVVNRLVVCLRFWDLCRTKRSCRNARLRNATVLSKKSHESVNRNDNKRENEMILETPKLSWKQVGETFDGYCFLVTSLIFLFMTSISMFRLYNNFGL